MRGQADEGSPPYWLFRQVLRELAKTLIPNEYQRAHLTVIAPEPRARPPRPDAGEQRFAVFETVREYLAVLDENTWGAATDVQPKFISESDPAAQWTAAKDGPAIFAYSDNYLIDLRSAVIVDVEASRSVRGSPPWSAS